MSQIDEAFIQAYATPHPSTTAPAGAAVAGQRTLAAAGFVPLPQTQTPLAGLHGGPHIHPPAAAQPPMETRRPTETQPAAWAPEPIPTPHFLGPSTDEEAIWQTVTLAASAQLAAEAVTIETTAAPPAEPATERRPLSTFSAPEPPATTAFNPLFEVDAFRWPKITDDLLSAHHQLLMPVAEQLLTVGEQGRSLVGIAGTRLGIGCTTVQLCLARMIAAAGKSVVLVDANFDRATLARDLGLEFDTGWEDVLTGRLPLAECVVKSLQDRMALLPLAQSHPSAEEMLSSIQTSVTAGVLRYHYDVVLFNLGAAGQSPQHAAAQSVMQGCRIDASIIVADTAQHGATDMAPIDPLMSLFGNSCLGVIGNSTATTTPNQ